MIKFKHTDRIPIQVRCKFEMGSGLQLMLQKSGHDAANHELLL